VTPCRQGAGTLTQEVAYGSLLHERRRVLHARIVEILDALARDRMAEQVERLPLMFPYAAAPFGVAYAFAGRLAEARPLLEQAVERATAMRRMVDYALWVAWLGEAALLAGDMQEACDFAQRALDCSLTYKKRGHQAWILRLLGDLQTQQQPANIEPAVASYQQALA
jgi:hypothetical protein